MSVAREGEVHVPVIHYISYFRPLAIDKSIVPYNFLLKPLSLVEICLVHSN